MATQITSRQPVIQARDYLNQFKEFERTVQASTNLEDSVVSLLQQCHTIHNQFKAINDDGLAKRHKGQFRYIKRTFNKDFKHIHEKLIGILKQVAYDTYTIACTATQWDADHPLPRDFLDRMASVKVRVADLGKIQCNKEVNLLVSQTRNLIYTSQELDHITAPLSESSSSSSSSSSLSFSYPIRPISSYLSNQSYTLGYAANRLAAIETTLYTQETDLDAAARELIDMETTVPLSIGSETMLMPIGGLVFYHLQMIQLNESPKQVDSEDPFYSIKAFANIKGCFSTFSQKQRAILRAKVDVLLHAYRAATSSGETLRANNYFLAIQNEEGLRTSLDEVPELAFFQNYNLLGYKSIENRLRYIDSIRAKMYAAWRLP